MPDKKMTMKSLNERIEDIYDSVTVEKHNTTVDVVSIRRAISELKCDIAEIERDRKQHRIQFANWIDIITEELDDMWNELHRPGVLTRAWQWMKGCR